MSAKICVVGIAGGSASGKTSLTRALTDFLAVQSPSLRLEVLHLDDFFRADKTGEPSFVSPSSGKRQFNFNHPDAINQESLIERVASLSSAGDAPDILVIEGLMTLQIPRLRALIDVRIFVELEADVRALRRLLRDMKGGRASTDPDVIANYYLESARIGHELWVEPSRVHADFIVHGDADFARIAALWAGILDANNSRKGSG